MRPRSVFGEPVWQEEDSIALGMGEALSDVAPAPPRQTILVRLGPFALVRVTSQPPEPERRPLGFRPRTRKEERCSAE